MINRLLPLRLLRAAGGTRPSRFRPASAAVLCRLDSLDFIFSDSPINDSPGHRCFSARPERSTSGFGSQDHRRGDFNSSGTAGQAKSLIEDEEELSDWVSDLGKDSFRSGLHSNDEDSDAERFKSVKGRSRDGGVDRFRSRSGKGDSFRSSKDMSSSRMQWDDDDDSDDFSSASGRGRFRDSRGGKGNSLRSMKGWAPSRKQWDDADDFSQPSGRGNSLSSKGRKGNSLRSMKDRPTSRRQWGDDFEGTSSRGRTRNSRDSLTKRQLDSDLEDEDEDENEEIGFSSRKKRDHGIRKETPTLSTRGVRDDDLKFKPTRSSRRSVRLESDEENNEENEDDDDLDDDILGDEDGKEVPINDVLKSFGSPEQDRGVNSQSVPKQSKLGNDSYLSQTR